MITNKNINLVRFAIRWLIVAIGMLAIYAISQAQPVFTGPGEGPTRPMPLGDFNTRPWLTSPNVSPYLLLDDRHPFDVDDNDEAIRYYLHVRPMLDYQQSLRRQENRRYQPQTSWTPHRPLPAYVPNSASTHRPTGSRFMNYGPYYHQYPYPSTVTQHHYRSQL